MKLWDRNIKDMLNRVLEKDPNSIQWITDMTRQDKLEKLINNVNVKFFEDLYFLDEASKKGVIDCGSRQELAKYLTGYFITKLKPEYKNILSEEYFSLIEEECDCKRKKYSRL